MDIWTKEWVNKDKMEDLGHQFHPWKFIPTTVAIKMMITKLRS